MTSRLMSQQRSKKGQASLPRSLPVTPERTRSALRGDGTLQFVSMSQNLTRCCRLTVHKSVPAVRIHLAHQRGIANRLSGLHSGPRVNGEAISAAPKAVMDISVEAKPQQGG